MKVRVDETSCIGCTKCIAVCPTDAIIGASKQMHVVLEEYCIGCQLCLPPCPTNCIDIIDEPEQTSDARKALAQMARVRIKARKQRQHQQEQQRIAADQQRLQESQDSIRLAIARSQKKWVWTPDE